MLEEARNMTLALRGPSDLEHAGEESDSVDIVWQWQQQEALAGTEGDS